MIAHRSSLQDFPHRFQQGPANPAPGDILTIERFEELDELFRRVSRVQFSALVDDPFHQRQLRSYEVLSWRRGLPVLLILVTLLLVGVAAGIIGLRQ